MGKIETGITDTGEAQDPLNRKTRRTTTNYAGDAQARIGDGEFTAEGPRQRATNFGRPPMLPSARRRLGMR